MDTTNPTQEPTFKLLKVTTHRGYTTHMPLNRINKEHHEEVRNCLDREKREKYIIEAIEVSLDQAVALGVSEAIQTRFPPKRRSQQNSGGNDEIMKMLVAQNAKLMEMLEAKNETPKTPKK